MKFEIRKVEEINLNILDTLTPYSFFATKEIVQLCMQVFEHDYYFAYVSDGNGVQALIPVFIENNQVSMAGYFGDHDLFDFAPLNFNKLEALNELFIQLKIWTKAQNLNLKLREIPFELVHALDLHEFSSSRDAIIPVTNIDSNSQTKAGKPIFKKKHRKEMRRKINRINAEDIKTKVVLDIKTEELKVKFLEFFSKSPNDEKQKFIESKAREYFRLILNNPHIKLSAMYFNEEVVSILVYFENNEKWYADRSGRKIIYLYNMASDPKMYDYSPGLVHVNSVIMDVIKNGYTEFNFLRGAERYKFEIGANACKWNMLLESSIIK